MKWLSITISLSLLHLLGPASTSAQPIPVSLPTLEAEPGARISVPIIVGNLTGREVRSYNALIQFNPEVLSALPPTSAETLSEMYGPPSFTLFDSLIVVRGAGPTPLSGSGNLVNLNFDVIGQPGDSSILQIVGFIFNTGVPGVTTTNGKFVVKSNPDIEVAPLTIQFGEVIINTIKSDTIQIANRGSAPLLVQAINLTGTHFSEFQIESGTPFELAPEDSRQVVVRFQPTALGEKTASLNIISNDPDEDTVRVALSGVAIPAPEPDIEVAPLTIQFGEVIINTIKSDTIQIANRGSAPLLVQAINLTGTHFSEFQIESGAPFELAPEDNRQVVVRFQPTALGEKTASLSIISNDPDEDTVRVALSSVAIPAPEPDIEVAPLTIQFGEVIINTIKSDTIQIANRGSAPLLVQAINLTGTHFSEFQIESGAPFELAPEDSRQVVVRFQPTALGEKTASLNIISNDPDEALVEILLTGTGAPAPAPAISVQPLSHDFGLVRVDSSATQTFVIANSGSANLLVSATALSGLDANQFAIRNGAPFSLAPGADTSLTVRFTPTSLGIKTARLNILSNAANQDTVMVELVGTGIGPVAIFPRFLEPADGAVLCSDSVRVVVVATVVGGVQPFDIECEINGVPCLRIDDRFEASIPLPIGKTQIEVVIRLMDSVGDTARGTAAITVKRFPPPEVIVEIVTPAENQLLTGDSVAVIARLQIRDGAPPLTIACDVNGVPAQIMANLFSAIIPCSPGVNDVIVACTVSDSCGNFSVSRDTVRVVCVREETQFLFGVDDDHGALIRVDASLSNPQIIQLGVLVHQNQPIKELEAMAWDPLLRQIFAIANSQKGRLFKINPAAIPDSSSNGQIELELVGITGSTHLDGIAIHPATGELFAVDTESDQLVMIDKFTAKTRAIGPLKFENVEGLAFTNAPQPLLYGIDNDTNQLITINTETGRGTEVSSKSLGFANVECLEFSADGRLFAFSDSRQRTFITIDVRTGVGAKFQTSGAERFDIEGLAFITLTQTITAATENLQPGYESPSTFILEQNYPNPFNPATTIRFVIPDDFANGVQVRLEIFNILGKRVRTLVDEMKFPGHYSVQWNGRDDNNHAVPSGAYIYQLLGKDVKHSKRMTLVK